MRGHLGICAALMAAASGAHAAAYQNFRAAIYVPVGAMHRLEDPKTREAEYRRISSQLRFDKVYLETFRSGDFANEAAIEGIKKFFTDHGITVSGGIAYSGPEIDRQFTTLDYESAHDRDWCRQAIELAARHFDEVILDDFFFYTSKSDADIAAKGSRSWTQYRLERMREVAENLVLKPARATNPRIKVIIKYPNWYEHFQGLGYDIDIEAKTFDAIYTGNETRDPDATDQLLQQYESYLIFRYFDNIRPQGGNRGGWVDPYGTRYVDRYAEQLWLTLFAKAPEITLFNWADLAAPQALAPGERPWSTEKTSFDWEAMSHQGTAPGWAAAAGLALEQADQVLAKLGKPIGIASYKPYQSSGEDFLHDYLGNLGIPIELTPEFPTEARLVLLTLSARQDPDILAKIKRQLVAGKSVVITAGLMRALEGHGLEDFVELEDTGQTMAVHEFVGAYGAGRGSSLNEPGSTPRSIVFPQISFLTNDAWPLIRGVAEAKGVPILLMDRYSRGVLYVLNIPDNPGDLYELPQPLTQALRSYLQEDFPVRLDAPSRVSLFAYDNGTFIVESFRDATTPVGVSVAGAHGALQDLVSGETVAPQAKLTDARRSTEAPRTVFNIRVPAHSYRVFASR